MNNEKFSIPDESGQYGKQGPQSGYDTPVAYDNQGRPLYAHPPTTTGATGAQAGTAGIPQTLPQPQPQPEPQTLPQSSQAQASPQAGVTEQPATHQYVHFRRAVDPQDPDIPPEIARRHKESSLKYPRLNLSKGEFIISDVRRHPIGLVQIWAIAFSLIIALMAVMVPLVTSENSYGQTLILSTVGLALMSFLIFGGALVASYVYRNNRFFLTNESVIQEIQTSLFTKHEQTVSLSNIEDASYYQNGIFPHLFNYGSIRLSTEGDETTYRFSYVANPKPHIAILNNAVEAFKNGRPVEVGDGRID